MNAVTCTHVTRRFGSLTAVDDISLQVSDGEIFGIIGPNGAGKTTLLSSIEGLDEPTSGEITVLGLHPVKDAAELARRTGIQLQQAALLPRLRVGEALELFSSFYDHPVPWRPLLERLGIASKEKTDVARLSGGERQRVFIALALVHDPELLFLDELTTALDPQARLAMWDVVRDIRERGKTVVLTTHYMEEAEALCDRVGVVDHGRLLALDAVPNLVASLGGGAEIRLRTSSPIPAALLEGLDGVSNVSVRDCQVRLHSESTRFPQQMIDTIERTGPTVSDVSVSAPSLEDVFLALTGRSMREED